MGNAESLRNIYREYVQKAEQLMAGRKPGDGLLGMGNKPQDAACHDWFDGQVAAEMATMQGDDCPEALCFMLKAEKEFPAPACARLMLIAVQRHGLTLIEQLSPKQAEEMLLWYKNAYAPFTRLPVQKEILKKLKMQKQKNV